MLKQGFKVLKAGGVRSFISQAFSYFYASYFSSILMPFVFRRFVHEESEIVQLDGYIKFAFAFKFLGVSIAPQQIPTEITSLIRIVEKQRPKRIIEIGTANGGTLYLFCKVAHPDAMVVSVDLRNLKWRRRFYERFKEPGQTIHFVRGSSHAPNTLEGVRSLLNGKKADFLFIDGDHSYEGVRGDFDSYSSLVRDGGVIALHDIAKFPPREVYEEVNKFWTEIKDSFDSIEIIDNPMQGCCGIGVIRKRG